MTAENHTMIVDQALKTIWSSANPSNLNALFGAGFEFRNFTSLDDVTDLDGLRQRIACVLSAHPRGRLELEDMLNLGDLVTVWWSLADGTRRHLTRATRAPRRKLLDGTCMFRLQEGRIVEMWELSGQLSPPEGCGSITG